MRTFDALRDRYAGAGPAVITGHRGFPGKYPENTLESFQAAVALGVDFVEFGLCGIMSDQADVVLSVTRSHHLCHEYPAAAGTQHGAGRGGA